ncbi:MAG: glycosyltransferase [Deltaproteobacteria bacterium]|nr:MAG: glycosyltransferase [Deltaproteobacteria bacterium]
MRPDEFEGMEMLLAEFGNRADSLLVALLDETIADYLTRSNEPREFRNLFLIVTRRFPEELLSRIEERGISVFGKSDIFHVWKRILFSPAKRVVSLQPYRKLLFFLASIPGKEKIAFFSGEAKRFSLPFIVRREGGRVYGEYTRRARMKRMRRKLKELRIFPYTVGFPNDYIQLKEELERKRASDLKKIPVSVIVPVYNRKKELERTLTALSMQSYPKELVDLIVADDGSREDYIHLLEGFRPSFRSVRLVRHEDRGYRLSAIRNRGIEASETDVVILLDCDMIPERDFVYHHAKWFHLWEGNIVVIGGRRFIDGEGLMPEDLRRNFSHEMERRLAPAPEAVRDEENPEVDWRERYYRKTDNLRFSPSPYRYASGGNVSFRKKYARRAGMFDESFQAWGGEDLEFFYRMYNQGAYFIPDGNALAYHQNHPDTSGREEGRERTRSLLECRVPPLRKRKFREGDVPRVSIYMPAYNSSRFIVEAVESVRKQTYDDWELCICDDGSTDGTFELVRKVFGSDHRVRIERIEHGGIGKASNHALRMCRGEFVGQLDSDDLLHPRAIETMVKFLEENPSVGVVYSDYAFIDSEGNIVGEGYSHPEYDPVMLLKGMIVHHFRMFRRLYWYRTSGFSEELSSAVDYDMFLKMSEVCWFHHLREVLYFYRLHGENTSIRGYAVQTENHVRAVEMALRRRGLPWRVRTPAKESRDIDFSL